jgi:peptidoglycan/LPS O-acetylase OafA/YrhL
MHKNGFDFLRLFAAFAVLFSHCWPLTGQNEQEPLSRALDGLFNFGEVAVLVFFSISGYLVARSWYKDPNALRFMQRRSLRVLPALAACILCCVLVGSAFSTLPAQSYFSHRETWLFLTKILVFPPQLNLPGVFADTPYPNVVNGSLWSLRLEFALYLVLAAIGILGLMRPSMMRLVVAVLLVAGIGVEHVQTAIPFAHQAGAVALYALPFFVAAALAGLDLDTRKMLKVLALLALICAPLLLVGGVKFYCALLLAPAILATAKAVPLAFPYDYSYGVYLWAFPVQQVCAVLWPSAGPLQMFALAAPITLLLAIASWHGVESICLAHKPRVQPLAV